MSSHSVYFGALSNIYKKNKVPFCIEEANSAIMNKLSEIIGMPVIALAKAERIGTVVDLRFDAKLSAVKSAEIFDENYDDDNTFFIPADKLRLGENAAVILSDSCIRSLDFATTARNPVNSECYNHLGKKLGYVCDVLLNGLAVDKFVTSGGEFTPDKLLRSSDKVCVFNDTDSPIKLPKPARRRAKSAPAPAAPLLQDAPPQPQQLAPEYDDAAQITTPALPLSVTVTHTQGDASKDYGFLLGKSVHSHIVSNGRILISAGTVVDENVIEFARREKKLVRLALQAY